MSLMMADVITESTMVEIERKINLLMKDVEKWDHEIIAFREQMQMRETAESIKLLLSKLVTKERMWCKKISHNNNKFLWLPSQFSSYRYDRELH